MLIEDDVDIQIINRNLFENAGYNVIGAQTLKEALSYLQSNTPDLIILDIMLPDGSGLDFCRELRGSRSVPPVLLLSAKSQSPDIVEGLRAGGDAYLSKPYDLDVLLANAEALLRRTENITEKLIKGPLMLDILADIAYLDGENMSLSPKEFSLLLLFAQNEGVVMSAYYLYEKIWKAPMGSDSQAIKKSISRLRSKLDGKGFRIESQYGEGYYFESI